jgi:hypothetical protein
MTIEELNKLIKEELDAYLDEEEGDDEVKVTTDEPENKEDEALDTLKQIFNMLKPIVDDEEEEEEEEGEEVDDEGEEVDDEGEDLEENVDLNEDMITASELAMLGGVMAANLGVAFKAAGGMQGLKDAIMDTGSTAKGIAKFLSGTNAGAGIKGGGRQEENMDHPNYRADYVKDVAHNAEKIKGGLNESTDNTARFKKLANIK